MKPKRTEILLLQKSSSFMTRNTKLSISLHAFRQWNPIILNPETLLLLLLLFKSSCGCVCLLLLLSFPIDIYSLICKSKQNENHFWGLKKHNFSFHLYHQKKLFIQKHTHTLKILLPLNSFIIYRLTVYGLCLFIHSKVTAHYHHHYQIDPSNFI